MKKLAVLAAAASVVAASTVFATGVLGDSDQKEGLTTASSWPVKLDLVRTDASAPGARATSAAIAAAKKKSKKVKIQFFVADSPISVPASAGGTLGGTGLLTGECPGKRRILSGFFGTDRAVVPDNSNLQGKKKWISSFVNLLDVPGEVTPGIVCIKGAK